MLTDHTAHAARVALGTLERTHTEFVSDLLASLPHEPDEIAALLHGLGITGARACPESCVIANWLRGHGLRISICPKSWSLIEPWKTYPMPAHVGRFLMLFDRGEYPELEG